MIRVGNLAKKIPAPPRGKKIRYAPPRVSTSQNIQSNVRSAAKKLSVHVVREEEWLSGQIVAINSNCACPALNTSLQLAHAQTPARVKPVSLENISRKLFQTSDRPSVHALNSYFSGFALIYFRRALVSIVVCCTGSIMSRNFHWDRWLTNGSSLNFFQGLFFLVMINVSFGIQWFIYIVEYL